MKLIRYLLFPVVPFYFMVTWLRNKCYDWGVFKSAEYDVPTICVGNLSVGGTGKTPMIEYLIRIFMNEYRIATLSRGYKRSTDGFILADEKATALTVGDEPFQFYNKFKDVIIAVDGDRQHGISKLLQLKDTPEIILLDDAYQHRKVKAKLNILLTPFNDLYVNDILLPTGNLREPRSGAKRADIIVVTKCPQSISENEKLKIIESLHLKTSQKVFFSWIDYSEMIINESDDKALSFLTGKNFTLVTGIANPRPLVEFLKSKSLNFEHLNFDDHHQFTSLDIEDFEKKKWLLTTEKDYMRLPEGLKKNRNIFYLPIQLELDEAQQFNALVKSAITLKS